MTPHLSAVIMAHPRRQQFVAPLQAKLDRPTGIIWDRRNDRWDTGRRAMLAYDPKATHHLVLQDDAVIPHRLLAGAEAALAHIPAGSPVCLYAGRIKTFRHAVARITRNGTSPVSWLTAGHIHWGVGIIVPTCHIQEMVAWCDRQTHIANYDKRLSEWCRHKRLTVHYPWPSLVDHQQSPSLVPVRGSRGRFAHHFLGVNASALAFDPCGRTAALPPLKTAASPRRQPPTQADVLRRQLVHEQRRLVLVRDIQRRRHIEKKIRTLRRKITGQ